MRNIILVALLGVFFLNSCNQTTKTNTEQKDSLATTVDSTVLDSTRTADDVIHAFVKAYAQKSNAGVNALIHPDLGLKIIHRPGAADTYTKVDSMDFAHPIPHYYPYPKIVSDYALSYGKVPVFDCGTEKWNKSGMYCDTTNRPNQLTTIMNFEKDYEPNKYSNAVLQEIQAQEKASYRVVSTTETPLVFHLTKYKGAWYVTVLDRAYGSCEA